MPSDKLPNSLSWKRALEYEAIKNEFLKIHEKREALKKENPPSVEEKIEQQGRIDEMIRDAEKELKELEKNPEFIKQNEEMLKEHRELMQVLEEIKKSNN